MTRRFLESVPLAMNSSSPAAPAPLAPPAGYALAEHRLDNAAGRQYVLRLWQPEKAGDARTRATLLMLDGHWLGQNVSDALARLPAGDFQVATLGYAVAERPTIAPWRAYDYTPDGPDGRQHDPRTPQWPCGGADATLAFIRHKVLPLLTHERAPAPGRVALFGHSYAGLFSLHCLISAPELFCRIYAASPSLWWYWPHMLSHVPPQARPLPPLQVLVGEEERMRLQPAQPGQPREPGTPTLPYAQQFVAALQAAGHAQTMLQSFPGEAHGPMLACAARHTLADFAQRSGLDPHADTRPRRP